MSPGTLTIDGSYTQSSGGALKIEIGAAGYDRLEATGPANLAGALDVTLLGGYVPTPCSQFRFLAYAAWNGDFATKNGVGVDLGSGMFLRLLAGPTGQTLAGYDSAKKVNIGPTAVNAAEGGAGASYGVCLGAQPSAPVNVTATPDSQVTVEPGVVSFTVADWGLVRTIQLSAVDDSAVEGVHTGTVSHLAASPDPAFDGAQPSVTATIADNEGVDIRCRYDKDSSGKIDKGEAISIVVDYLLQKVNGALGRTPTRGEAVQVLAAYLTQQPFTCGP